MLIYKLTNRVNGLSYIGATRQPLRSRLCGHRSKAGRGRMLMIQRAIQDHGWDNFEVSVLGHASSLKELMEMERGAIVLYKTLAPHGYNMVPGGEGIKPIYTPKPAAWNKGKQHPPEVKAKMSASHTGGNNARARQIEYGGVVYGCIVDAAKATGLSRSQMYRRLRVGIAKYLNTGSAGPWSEINKGRKASPETRAKLSAARKGHRNWNARAIEFEGRTYPSIEDAVAATGLSRMQFKTRLKNGQAKYIGERPRIT